MRDTTRKMAQQQRIESLGKHKDILLSMSHLRGGGGMLVTRSKYISTGG